MVQSGAQTPVGRQTRAGGRASAQRRRNSPARRPVRAAARADHLARQRDRQLRPGRAAARRRTAGHERLQRLLVGARRSRAGPGRHPAVGPGQGGEAGRPGIALRAFHLPQRHLGRAVRRRLRRDRLHQLRSAGGARQRAGRTRHHGRGRAAVDRAARPASAADAPHVGHQRTGAGDRGRHGASARLDGMHRQLRQLRPGAGVRRCGGARQRHCQEGSRFLRPPGAGVHEAARRVPARRLSCADRRRRPRQRSTDVGTGRAVPGSGDLPQDSGGNRGEQPHAARIHLEPHDAERLQGRQEHHLPAKRLCRRPACRAGQADGEAARRRGPDAHRIYS